MVRAKKSLPAPGWYVAYDVGEDRHGQFFWTEEEALTFSDTAINPELERRPVEVDPACHVLAEPGSRFAMCKLKDPLPCVLPEFMQAHVDGHGMVICADCLKALGMPAPTPEPARARADFWPADQDEDPKRAKPDALAFFDAFFGAKP